MDVGIPDLLLIVAGLLSLLIVHSYRKDKDSSGYKAMMILGFLAGVGIVIACVALKPAWASYDKILIIIAAFALIIRPFRNTDLAIVFALLVAACVYVYLGTLTGNLDVLAEGWPRIIVALIAGAFVYMILNFLQKLAQLFGKILNMWPVLFLLGLVCLIEGVLIIVGGESLFDMIREYTKSTGSIIMALR